jgi:hypothetical protein
MNSSIDRIGDLERINYIAALPVAQATPGVDLLIEADIILMSNELVPDADSTHACLLRTRPEAVDGLISRAIDHFSAKALPTTIFISPACAPADLAQQLLRRGFIKRDSVEAWLTFDLYHFNIPPALPDLPVRQVTGEETCQTFVKVWAAVFDIPAEFAPLMVQLMLPSSTLPGVYHNIAFVHDQPAAVCSLICHQKFGILGGFGVMPEHRGGRVLSGLAIETMQQAQRYGVETLIVQTTADTRFERFLTINGFKRIFTRTGYTFS